MNPPDAAAADLSPRQQREEWAQRGQFEPLLEELDRLDPSLMDYEFHWQLVLQAIEVRALQDPEAFAGEILARLVAFTSYLTLRSQRVVQGGLQRHDRESSGAGLPPELEAPLESLLGLQAGLAGLLESQAAVARKWNLAKRRGRNRTSRKQSTRAKESSKAAPSTHGNGHGGLLDVHLGNGSSTNGHVNRLNGNGKHHDSNGHV